MQSRLLKWEGGIEGELGLHDIQVNGSCSHLTIPKERKVDMKEVATPNSVKRAGNGGTVPYKET